MIEFKYFKYEKRGKRLCCGLDIFFLGILRFKPDEKSIFGTIVIELEYFKYGGKEKKDYLIFFFFFLKIFRSLKRYLYYLY